jgi:hypothetical protein
MSKRYEVRVNGELSKAYATKKAAMGLAESWIEQAVTDDHINDVEVYDTTKACREFVKCCRPKAVTRIPNPHVKGVNQDVELMDRDITQAVADGADLKQSLGGYKTGDLRRLCKYHRIPIAGKNKVRLIKDLCGVKFNHEPTPKQEERGMPSYPGGPRRKLTSPKKEQKAPEPKPVPSPGEKATPEMALARSLGRAPKNLPPHVVVRALAGTGKTFSEIVGVAKVFAPNHWQNVVDTLEFDPVPSEEQQAIWDSFALSTSSNVKSITYCAFNKSIVSSFGSEWGWLQGVLSQEGITLQFNTVNGLGHRTCMAAFGSVRPANDRTLFVLAKLLGEEVKKLRWKRPTLVSAVSSLVDKCKLSLTGWDEENGFDPSRVDAKAMDALVKHFDIELEDLREEVYELVPQVLQACLKVNGMIDFNDQNWLPVVLNLPTPKVDLLLVDEAQDLPRCKQEFCRRVARRMVLTGDVNQAIYGFAGADTDSIPRMEKLLSSSGECQTLTLTETRRCGKAIVKEAQKYVPEFRAHESNPKGSIHHSTLAKYHTLVADGDMVLSRVNAPLVSQALKMLKAGRKVVVRGRDFGGALIKFIEKLKAADVPDLVSLTERWMLGETEKEQAKRSPSETRIQALQDRYEVICCFAEGAESVEEVISSIDLVFAGKVCPKCGKHYKEEILTCFQGGCQTEKDPITGRPCGPGLKTPEGILFSSVHRAKGLESKRVFILKTKNAPMPHPMAKTGWARAQEYNLMYVAVTRAIEELVYVTD